VNDSSLPGPAPASDTAVGPPPAPPASLLRIVLEDFDLQTSLQSKILEFADEVTASEIEGDVLMLEERKAGQWSPPAPPALFSQSAFSCLVDDSSLPEPHATIGPGGRPLHKTLKNGSPRRKLTVYEGDGKLQFTLVKGTKIKVGIFQEHLDRIPDARKSQSGTVNPLLGVSTLVLSKDEYVDMACAMYPTSKDQQTATKNLRKLWCSFAMTSHPKISETGTYI